jgi:hypothetical protein
MARGGVSSAPELHATFPPDAYLVAGVLLLGAGVLDDVDAELLDSGEEDEEALDDEDAEDDEEEEPPSFLVEL